MTRAAARMLASLALALSIAVPAIAAEPALPRDSVYQSSAQLVDAHGMRFAWRAKRGEAQVVSMLYTSCKFVCPMIVEGAKAIEQQLAPEERAHLGVTLISMDPVRDTPAVLARMARERGVDSPRWTLASPDPKDVRSIAGLLGVRYRALADGEFNHNTVLVLLDAEGRVVARTERVAGTPDAAFVAAIRRTVGLPSTH